MGLVYADIELINSEDIGMARRNLLDEMDIKRTYVNMLVDSGAYMMAINEEIQEQLQLPYQGKRKSVMADGTLVEHVVVGPVKVIFKNRDTVCNALVLAGNTEPLLGAIPMEEMDVLIHPLRNELIVNPESPDFAMLKLK